MTLLRKFFHSKWPHYFSGILLLMFAASHFMMLTVHSPSQHSINPVFPYFTNQVVYLWDGIFELITAVICLRYRGTSFASLTTFIFVLVMIWYRWALSYTEGSKNCDCLGILGRALHLTKAQEAILPIIVLILLSLTITPWLFGEFKSLVRLWRSRTDPSRIVTFMVFLFLCHSSSGQQTIAVSGQYETHHFNPKKGTLYTNETRHVAFTCKFSGNSWSIYATNIDTNPEGDGLRTPWEAVVYDGSDIYTLMPYHVELMGRSWTVENEQGKGSSIRATISHGPIFIRDYDEYLDFYSIWIAYGLCPTNLPREKNGVVEIPLPWYEGRRSPTAYGCEWDVSSSENKNFASGCLITRNTTLTLDDRNEMFRKDITPPKSLGDRNRFMELLQYRAEVSNGAIEAAYKCNEYYKTNGITVPRVSELTVYDDSTTNYPLVQAWIKATNVTVGNVPEQLLPTVSEQRFVADYRYRRANGNQVSPFVEYVLSPGVSWKSDKDQKLTQAASAFLHDVSNFSYQSDNRRGIFTWLLLVFILAPLIVVLKLSNKKQREKNNENKT